MEKSIIIDYNYNNFKLENKYDKVLIITDKNVHKYQFSNFIKNINHSFIEVFIVESGEESKSLSIYE